MGRPRRTIHIDRKTESLSLKDDAVRNQRYVVHYELLKPRNAVNTKRYQLQLTDLNRSLLERARISSPDLAPSHRWVTYLLGSISVRTKT